MAYQVPVWWGRLDFALGQTRAWHMAGFDLAITRGAQEWRFQTRRNPGQHEDQHQWRTLPDAALPEDTPVTRHFFKKTGDALYMLPRLADRSVVIKPVNPVFIPAGEEVTLYVSTPVWVACYAEHFDAPLLDLPVVRPTDTWFGPNTVKGEVCYATRVFGRTDLSQLPPRPFRAVTPIILRNHGADTMPVERINMPVPLLPVYASENGRLWTPPLHVQREAGSRTPRIRLESAMSAEAGTVELLTPARISGGEHALIRLFDNFFD